MITCDVCRTTVLPHLGHGPNRGYVMADTRNLNDADGTAPWAVGHSDCLPDESGIWDMLISRVQSRPEDFIYSATEKPWCGEDVFDVLDRIGVRLSPATYQAARNRLMQRARNRR